MSELLEQLKSILEKKAKYDRASTLISWDMETTTPKDGFDKQAEAYSFFSTESFKLTKSENFEKILDGLLKEEEYKKLDDKWKFIVKKMKKNLEKDKRVPEDFFEDFVKQKALAGKKWQEAKKQKDYQIFAPSLQKVIELTKRYTEYTDPGKDTYDVLIDLYEEGMDSKTIDGLFEDIKKELLPFTQEILQAKQPSDEKFKGHYDIEAQKRVQELLLKYIGFSFDKGAVGETEHPFTINFSSKDVRVTNHYYEEDALSAMFSAIHEGGHAIFEQNVNPDYDETAAGSCEYMGIHESQSRFYENILGRNKNFWVPVYEQLGELLPQFKAISLDEFYKEINHVRKSLIRCDADDLTYCFHIIIRYEVEKAIFRDGVSVDELPKLWNKKMKEYLDIVPSNDAEGILQDMHWSGGSFGYFPSYLLGSIYDGMFLEEIQKELGDVDEILKSGNIKKITEWLNKNIHQYGSTRTPKEVITQVCKKEVSAKPLIKFFKEKYSSVYEL